jgi:hypothetical protein
VRPLLGDLDRYCDSPEEEDEDDDAGEGYTGGYDRSAATDTDSYYAHDGTPYGNHSQNDDDDDDGDESEENWSDDADHIAARGYQRDVNGGSGYDAAAGDPEEAGEPCGREDGVAHHAHDVDYCEQHRPRTSAEWDSMARDWTQEFHRIVRGMDDTSSTHDAKKRMHVAEQLVPAPIFPPARAVVRVRWCVRARSHSLPVGCSKGCTLSSCRWPRRSVRRVEECARDRMTLASVY